MSYIILSIELLTCLSSASFLVLFSSVTGCFFFFFWKSTASSEIYTLSLHDALPIFLVLGGGTALATYVVSSNSQIAPGTVSGHKDRKSTRLNSSHVEISYAVFCLKKKNTKWTAVGGSSGLREDNNASALCSNTSSEV